MLPEAKTGLNKQAVAKNWIIESIPRELKGLGYGYKKPKMSFQTMPGQFFCKVLDKPRMALQAFLPNVTI